MSCPGSLRIVIDKDVFVLGVNVILLDVVFVNAAAKACERPRFSNFLRISAGALFLIRSSAYIELGCLEAAIFDW